jgi:SAM-dependent methyltransferase
MDREGGQPADARQDIYQDLHADQLSREETANARSAARILDVVLEYHRPASVLDVGCGLGTWLKVARSRGISDIKGIEGAWLDPTKLQVEPHLIENMDLERPFDLKRRFDLVISLEVAEHVSADAADGFVASLARHASVVLFSAAIPFQGGHHHVNEQFLPYWVERFSRFNFKPLNMIRSKIWEDRTVLWWLRQNVLLFAEQEFIADNEHLRRAVEEGAACPLSLVHPDVYLHRMHTGALAVQKMNQVANAFGRGGLFRVEVGPDGTMRITPQG